MRMSSCSSVAYSRRANHLRVPALDDAEPKALSDVLSVPSAPGSYAFLRSSTTIVTWLERLMMRRGAPMRARQKALLRLRRRRPTPPSRRACRRRRCWVVLGVGDRRLERLGDRSCAARFGLNSRTPSASSTRLPRIRSTTRRAFCGAIRTWRVLARASMSMPSLSYFGAASRPA